MEQPPKETLRQKDHSARAIWREAPSAPTEGNSGYTRRSSSQVPRQIGGSNAKGERC